MLFRKKKNPTSAGAEVAAESGDNAAKIRALKRSMRRQIVTMSVCLVVATAATMTFLTTAWFARNEKVSSTNSNIRSNSATPSLYIRKQGDSTTAFLDAYNVECPAAGENLGLFPISTGDLTNWYYASKFTYRNEQDDPIPAEATEYSQAEVGQNPVDVGETTTIAYKYENSYEGAARVAYYATKLNLYTVPGTYMDVYFNPDAPISVQYVGNAPHGSTGSAGEGAQRDLLNALRVGVLVGNNRIIYAPVSEADEADKKGNDTSTTDTDSFHYVGSTNGGSDVEVQVGYVIVSWVDNGYVANKLESLDTYEKGATKLGTADSVNGLDVTIFVWLEGTDADALVGISDGDVAGINVTVSFVGTDGRTTETIESNEQA